MTLVVSCVSYPNTFPSFDPSSDSVLVCLPHQLFVCDLVLPFYFVNVSDIFVYECLEFLTVVSVTLHV